MRSTSPRSVRSVTTRPAAATTSPSKPTGRHEKQRCAASNDASATPSTDNSAPTSTTNDNGSGRTIRGDFEIQRGRQIPETGTSEKSLPNPTPTLRRLDTARHGLTQRAQTACGTSPLTQTGFALA